MATLQKQGVPIPSKLNGPQPKNIGEPNGPQTRSSSPSRTSRGSAPRRSSGGASQSVSNSQRRRANGPQPISSGGVPNPVSAGTNATAGVGLLEAEFLTALGILVLLMFSDSTSSMTAKMMDTMKRGTLICAVFFILAIVSGIGPNAAKTAKALGALIIVATLVTSPINTVLTDIDGIIKNTWIGADPSSGTDTGSGSTPKSTATPASDLESAVEQAAEATINPVGNVLKPLLSKIGINIP